MRKPNPLPFFPDNKPMPTAETGSATDLKSRFLELQLLRQKVRIAECGRIARTLDGSNHKIQFSLAEPSKQLLRATD